MSINANGSNDHRVRTKCVYLNIEKREEEEEDRIQLMKFLKSLYGCN